jgi:hypothetical protein
LLAPVVNELHRLSRWSVEPLFVRFLDFIFGGYMASKDFALSLAITSSSAIGVELESARFTCEFKDCALAFVAAFRTGDAAKFGFIFALENLVAMLANNLLVCFHVNPLKVNPFR